MSLFDNAFGDGRDGAGVFDGTTAVTGFSLAGTTYTQTKDVNLNTLAEVDAGITVKPSGYHMGGTGTLRVWGTIQRDGNAGEDAPGTTPGAALSGANRPVCGGSGAGQGGTIIDDSLGGSGGASGQSADGGGPNGDSVAGQVTTAPGATWCNPYRQRLPGLENVHHVSGGTGDLFTGNAHKLKGGAGGGHGGGGGTVGGNGGGGAGCLAIAFPRVIVEGTGIISAVGGAGGAGSGVALTGGGGGGGGGGGIIWITTRDGGLENNGRISVAGGEGGLGGTSTDPGQPGYPFIGDPGVSGSEGNYFPWTLPGTVVTPPVVDPPPTVVSPPSAGNARAGQRWARIGGQLPRISTEIEKTDRAIEPIRNALNVLNKHPVVGGLPVLNVELEDNAVTRVPHGLGRAFTMCLHGVIEGMLSVGAIELVPGSDPTREVWLRANGYGATITVALYVF